MKIYVNGFVADNHGGGNIQIGVVGAFYDETNHVLIDNNSFDMDLSGVTTEAGVKAAAITSLINYATSQSYSVTASDIIWSIDASIAPLIQARSFANPTRTLNSAFQISSTRDAMVSYTVDIGATISLTSGQAGTVTLQYADDSGQTTNVKTVQSSVNGNTGTLTLGLNLTQTVTAILAGIIPAGKYVKLVTANTTGSPSFSWRAGQEVLL